MTSISSEKTKLGKLTPDIILHFLHFFYFDRFSRIPQIVLSELNDMSGTAFSVPFSLTLKETTLYEQGI